MALALLLLGLVLVDVGYRGTYADLASQLASDMPGFLPWLGAVVLIGALGYAPSLETFSNALLVLVILVLLLVNGGAWANLSAAFGAAQQSPLSQSVGLIPTQADAAALAGGPTVTLNAPAGSSSGSTATTALGAAGAALKAIPFIGGLF